MVARLTPRQARPPQPGKRPGPGVRDRAPCLGIAYFASHAIFLLMGCCLSAVVAEDSEAIRRTSDSSDSCVLKNGHQPKAGPGDSSPEAVQSFQPPYAPQTTPGEPHQPVMPGPRVSEFSGDTSAPALSPLSAAIPRGMMGSLRPSPARPVPPGRPVQVRALSHGHRSAPTLGQ